MDRSTEQGEGGAGRVYDGFISYSHAADGLFAPRLQSALQRFAKPWWKRRAVRIFRDESSLSANPHLWSSITDALDASGWFVLLLSPDAASSEWVNQEIAYWTEHRDPSRILPVLTDGEFGWAGGDVTGDAVPEALRGSFAEEPRWVDMRFARDEEQLDLKNPRFSAAVADVASAIRDVPKDELESEEVRQHRRTIRTAWAAGLALALLSILAVAASVFAVGQRNAARAEALGAHAINQLQTDPELAILLAMESLDADGGSTTAAGTLLTGLVEHRTTVAIPGGNRASPLPTHAVSIDERIAVLRWEENDVTLYEPSAGEIVWRLDDLGEERLVAGVFDQEGENLYVLESGYTRENGGAVATIHRIDAMNGERLEGLDIGPCAIAVHPGSADGVRFPIVRSRVASDGVSCDLDAATVGVLDVESRVVTDLADYAYPFGPGGEPTITADGELLAVGDVNGVRIVETDAGEIVETFPGRSISTIGPRGVRLLLQAGDFVESWNVRTRSVVGRFPVSDPVDATFSPDGSVAISAEGGTIHVFDSSANPIAELTGHTSLISAISMPARNVVVSEAGDGIRVWDLEPAAGLPRLELELPGLRDTGHPGGLQIAGDRILVPYHNLAGAHRYAVLDLEGGLLRESGPVGEFAMFPDGSSIVQERWEPGVLPSGVLGGVVEALEIVDAESGSQVGRLDACPYALNPPTRETFPVEGCDDWIVASDIEVSADGSRIAAIGSWWNSTVWDAESGERVWESDRIDPSFPWAHQIGFLEDGSRVAVLDMAEGGLRSLSLDDGDDTDAIAGRFSTGEMLSHPDDPILFVADSGGRLLVIDAVEWEVVSTLIRPGSRLIDAALSPDGAMVTAVTDGGVVLSWDWRLESQLLELDLGTELYHVAHLDEQRLLVMGSDGTATVVPLDPDVLRSIAVDRLTRSFTETECVTYGIDPCPTLEALRSR